MVLKLYGDVRSPCVRSVLLTIKTLNIDVEYVPIDVLKQEHLKPEFLKINPRHTVPCLEHDGFAVWDSHAIMVYLGEKFGKNNPVYPEDSQKRAVINQMLFFETGDFFSMHRFIGEQILYNGSKVVQKDAGAFLKKSYEFLETFLKNSKYVTGNNVTIADFSFYTTLSNSQIFEPIDEKKYPNISKWFKLMDSLPHTEQNKLGRTEFKNLFDKLMA